MKPSSWVLVFWSGLIVVLLLIEVAEITHLFTLPIQLAIGDPLAFVFALVATTIFALVGAIFIGVYFSARILRRSGFTPFEEEMLRMRVDVRELKDQVEQLRASVEHGADPPPPTGGRT
ncbi:MAG TPA: hypothetical protein VEL82_01255 [Thermoplasmata archaeon]|nr:hypothetical protein [Thermoplasmata archaeon]